MKRNPVLASLSLLVLVMAVPAHPQQPEARPRYTLEQIREAAEAGHANAQFLLGRAYERGQGVARSLEEARSWYEKAAEQDQIEAQFALSSYYGRGVGGVARDPERSLHWLFKAAENGHHAAEWNISSMHCAGRGLKRDIAECLRWARRSAGRGFAHAQHGLALYYFEGELVERDLVEAERLARLGAEQLHYPSITLLALIYRDQGGMRNPEVIERLHGMAADLGSAYSQADLGRLYRQGAFGQIDYAQAYERYAQAAAQRVAPAQFALGEMEERGEGREPNESAALKWYLRAAENGWAAAHCKAGQFLAQGRGGPADPLRGLMHLQIGARLKADVCTGPMQSMERQLGAVKAREADAMAGEWEMDNPQGTRFPAGQYRFGHGIWVPWPGEGPIHKRGASTPQERQRAVELARKLERDPLQEDDRQWLLNFWREVPDRSFFPCPRLVEQPENSPLHHVMMFSAAAFTLEHPGESPDDVGALAAGVAGAVRAYEAMLAAERTAQLPHLEMLRGLAREGRLAEWVRQERRTRCRIGTSPPAIRPPE